MQVQKRTNHYATPYRHIDRDLGNTFKSFRTKLNKTQEDISAILGISKQQYQKCESGSSRWSLRRIYVLADYFNRDIRELLPPPESAKIAENDGFSEGQTPFGEDTDARAVASIVETFTAIKSKSTRKKVLDLLDDLD